MMLYDCEDFFDKYMNFCHDEVKRYGYYAVTSVILAFRDFLKDNMPDIDSEKENKIREELFDVEVWLLDFVHKFIVYLEGAESLDGRMIYQPERKFLYDIINRDNVVIVDDSYWRFVAIEKEDIEDIKDKVRECMEKIA